MRPEYPSTVIYCWYSTVNFESRFDIIIADNLQVSLPIFRSTGDQFSPLPHWLRWHALFLHRYCRGGGGGRRYRRCGCHAKRCLASQGVGIRYMARLMPRVRVSSLRVLLALAGGHRRVFARLQSRRVDIWPRDLQHSFDIGGLGPESREGTFASVRKEICKIFTNDLFARWYKNIRWYKTFFNAKSMLLYLCIYIIFICNVDRIRRFQHS